MFYERTVTKLEAANNYKPSHLMSAAMLPVWQKAQFFYSAGFFLTVSVPALLEVAEHALASGKTMMLNLSAPFICQFFKDQLTTVLPYADIIFGNESECEAFGKAMEYPDLALETIALKLASFPTKNAARPRMAVITQGSRATMVAYNGQVRIGS